MSASGSSALPIYNLAEYRGGFALVGPQVDVLARKWIEQCTDATFRASLVGQQDRDDCIFHVTVMTAQERRQANANASSSLPNNVECYDLGVGTYRQCFFVVLYSPQLQRWRASYELPPANFHLTLGFASTGDVHGVDKSARSLFFVGDDDDAFCTMAETALRRGAQDEWLAQALCDRGLLCGPFYLAKLRLKQSGLKSTYLALKSVITDVENCKRLSSGEDYGRKVCKVLNHNVHVDDFEKRKQFYRCVDEKKLLYRIECIEMPRNFSFVTPRLIGSSLLNKRVHFEALVGLGATDVITVMENPVAEILYAGLPSLRYHFFEVDDLHPPTVEQMRQMMRVCDEGALVAVHCMGGVGRTATVIGAHLMWSEGLSKQAAVARLAKRKTILSHTQDQFLSDWYAVCDQRKKLDVQLPPVLMCIGYPAAGKSTFCEALCAAAPSETVHRINQDEQGRKECVAQMGALSKRRGHTVLLDRCNLTAKERREWLTLAHNQRAWAVFFDVSIEECMWRIVRRQGHPSIKPGGGRRIIQSLQGLLEPPSAREEGFEKIITVSTFDQVNSLLLEWGCSPVQTTLPKEDRLIKFPRTRHAANLGGATRDDLVLTKWEVDRFLRRPLVIEEKIDGANMGISIKENRICVQNRSHYVTSSYHAQFKYLDKWVLEHENDLWTILTSDRFILYGEWLYAKHSIPYSRLSDWFMAFDLFDRLEQRFVSRARLERLVQGTSIHLVPLIAAAGIIDNVDELEALVKTPSRFYDGPVEGVLLRICDDDWVVERAKLVRSDFICGQTKHWCKATGVEPNSRIRIDFNDGEGGDTATTTTTTRTMNEKIGSNKEKLK